MYTFFSRLHEKGIIKDILWAGLDYGSGWSPSGRWRPSYWVFVWFINFDLSTVLSFSRQFLESEFFLILNGVFFGSESVLTREFHLLFNQWSVHILFCSLILSSVRLCESVLTLRASFIFSSPRHCSNLFFCNSVTGSVTRYESSICS